MGRYGRALLGRGIKHSLPRFWMVEQPPNTGQVGLLRLVVFLHEADLRVWPTTGTIVNQ